MEINPKTGCYCTFAQQMVGDGCCICNSSYAEELRSQSEEDDLLEGAKNTEQPPQPDRCGLSIGENVNLFERTYNNLLYCLERYYDCELSECFEISDSERLYKKRLIDLCADISFFFGQDADELLEGPEGFEFEI